MADLEGIWLYTLRHWSLEQADSYLHDLVATFEASTAGKKPGREVDVRPGYLKYPTESHVIYFRDRGDQLEVIHILHQKQDVKRHL